MQVLTEPYNDRCNEWTSAVSGRWTDPLFQSCMIRLKAQVLIGIEPSRDRSREIVIAEANKLPRAHDQQPPHFSDEDMDTFIHDLQNELEKVKRDRKAKTEALRVLDGMVRDKYEGDSNELPHAIEMVEVEARVVCPLCENGLLCHRDGIVYCKCGLRLDGCMYDTMTLEKLRDKLREIMEEHQKRGCFRTRPPTFACKECLGMNLIHAFCDACDLDCIVL